MPSLAVAPRRSQLQRRAEMRERLLDATVEALVECGYAGTTTLEVQRRAGVSRGALLHYYPSRQELVFDALGYLFERASGELRAHVEDADNGPGRLERAVELLWSSFSGPLFRGALELWTAAHTDVELRRALIPRERALGHEIRRLCQDLFGPELSNHPRFEATCELLVQAMRGGALSSVVRFRRERDVAFVAHLKEMAALMLDGPTTSTGTGRER
jgi:AcrR family transcriptional regulator